MVKPFRTFKAAMKAMPKCLVASGIADWVGIEAEAKHNCENPIAILRDLVHTELNLIAEGEATYGTMQKKWIRNYWENLCGSV